MTPQTTCLVAISAVLLSGGSCPAVPSPVQGAAFSRKVYQPKPLPRFAELRDKLPAPLFNDKPEWVAMYWLSLIHISEPTRPY